MGIIIDMFKKINITIFIFLITVYIYSNKLISGTVIDCKTNLPLMGAEILIKDNRDINPTKVLSNFDGFFEININQNTKEILIRYPKYKELKVNLDKEGNLGDIVLFKKRGCKKK